jgi:hypothetical protein
MHVKVEAQLRITSAPIERVGRRATDPPLKTRRFVYATARGDDCSPIRWSIYAFTPTSRAALAKLDPGAAVTVRGSLAVKVANGAPIVAIECRSIRSPKSSSPKQSGHRSTPMASAAGVARAHAEWIAKHGGAR